MIFDLKARLAEMGVVPKKSLGQNFLVSPHVIGKVVQAVQARHFNELVEIGPGLGALTEPLLQVGLRPRVIELDADIARYWRARGLEVLGDDALAINWNNLHLKLPALLVSNLPYQISTHLVVARCFGPPELHFMVLMFQKEVARRLQAEPRTKDYGLLSVIVQLHFRMRRVADASPGDFFPPPKVASRVLSFERLPEPGLGEPFLKFLKAAFAFRRKFLLKNLKSVVNKAVLEAAFADLGLSPKVRAEELPPAQFVELFNKTRCPVNVT